MLGWKKFLMLSWSGLWLLLCLLNPVDVVALVLFLVVFSCRWFASAAIVVCVSKPSSCILPAGRMWTPGGRYLAGCCQLRSYRAGSCSRGSRSRYGWAHVHPFPTSITSRERKNHHLYYIMVYHVCLIRRSRISKWWTVMNLRISTWLFFGGNFLQGKACES